MVLGKPREGRRETLIFLGGSGEWGGCFRYGCICQIGLEGCKDI